MGPGKIQVLLTGGHAWPTGRVGDAAGRSCPQLMDRGWWGCPEHSITGRGGDDGRWVPDKTLTPTPYIQEPSRLGPGAEGMAGSILPCVRET